MTRLGCLFVPLFPLAARLRSEPDLTGEAVAILEGNGSAARVTAASRRARKAGVRTGMSLPQARALVPKITPRARDEMCERSAQENLLETAESFSPRVEDAGEGVVYLEVSGLERRFPGKNPERDLGHALGVATRKAGIPAWVGIASSKLAARVAAEQPDSPTLVDAGREARFLAPLSPTLLSSEAEIVATLRRWGIRTVGDFAKLPRNEVASRLGDLGRELHQKARGLDPRPLVPYQPPPTFVEGLELDWPLVALEPFLFMARAAVERLCRRLEGRGLACAEVEISLTLEPDGHHQSRIALPAPTCEIKTLLTLIRLDLEANPPGGAIVSFTLGARPDRPREAQLSLFGPTALSPDRLATTLARLFALLGPNRVGSPREVDGHRPERVTLVAYEPPPPPKVRPPSQKGHGLLAVRVLRPPVPLEVLQAAGSPDTVDEAAIAPPAEVLPVVAEGSTGRPGLQGRVEVASGPWHLEEGWWTEEPVARDYWDVELADGGLYRIYRERASGEWFADGIYD